MGFLQSAIFSWDPINGQQSVPNLQQSTPSHTHKKNTQKSPPLQITARVCVCVCVVVGSFMLEEILQKK